MKKITLTIILTLLAVFFTFAAPKIVVQDEHPSSIDYLKFSSDGKYLFSTDDGTQIKIWEYESGMLLKTIIKKDESPADLSPDGMSCVYVDENNNLIFHDLRTDKIVLLETYKYEPDDIKFAPNGKSFIIIDAFDISMYDTQNFKKTSLIDTRNTTSGTFHLYTCAFFPNSNLLAVCAKNKSKEDNILVIDIQKKSISRIYNTKSKEWGKSLDVSKNGEYIACSDSHGNAVLINNSTGRIQNIDLKNNDAIITPIKFSQDSKKIYSASQTSPQKIIQYDIKSNTKNLKEFGEFAKSLTFSPKTEDLILGEFQSIQICDLNTLKLKRNITPNFASSIDFFPKSKQASCLSSSHKHFLFTDDFTFTGTEKYLYSGTAISDSGYFEINKRNNLIKYRSPDNKYSEFPLQKKIENWYDILENPNASLFAIKEKITDKKTRLHIYDFNDRNYYCYIATDENYFQTRKISPLGNYIISNGDKETKVYTKPDKKNDYSYTVFSFKANKAEYVNVVNVNFSPDEHYVAVEGEKAGDKIIYDTSDSKTWKAVRTFERCYGDACFSNDNKYIVLDDSVNLNMFEISTGNKIKTFKTNNFGTDLCFSADDTKLYVTDNGKLQCYSVKTGELLAELYVDNDGDYLVYTPDGYFTGTEGGINKFVHVVDGMEATELGQLAETFYRPDIVAAKIRGENIEKLKTASFSDVLATGNAPVVKFDDIPASSQARDITVSFSVEDKGGGIGSVFLKLNGKVIQLASTSRKLELVGGTASSQKKETAKNIKTFSHLVTLQNGENTIEAYATNSAGKIESRHASAKIKWHGTAAKPNLYVLAVGINKYNDIVFRLNYAVPDATSIASFFEKSAGGLYQSVNVSTVIDGDVTAAGISKAFDSLKSKVSADDVFVFYLSGHGTTYKGDGDYYFLPVDFRWKNEESIRLNGLSKSFITENLSKIKAQKTLIMLDTCNSGAFVSAATRGIEEKMAIDRLSRATGQAIISASSNDQSAMEGFEGHGIFTYVLLEGLSGKADSNRDGYISLIELSSYVEEKVPEYSFNKWGYMQNPQSDLKTANFPLVGK